jgi:hypothetical protein
MDWIFTDPRYRYQDHYKKIIVADRWGSFCCMATVSTYTGWDVDLHCSLNDLTADDNWPDDWAWIDIPD